MSGGSPVRGAGRCGVAIGVIAVASVALLLTSTCTGMAAGVAARPEALSLATPTPTPVPTASSTPAPSTLTVSPAHGQASQTFELTYRVACRFAPGVVMVEWDGAALSKQQFGSCAEGTSSLSVVMQLRPPAKDASPGVYAISAEASTVLRQSPVAQPSSLAEVEYTIDPVPSTAASTPSALAPSPSPGTRVLAASNQPIPPATLGGFAAVAAVVIAGIARLLARRRFRKRASRLHAVVRADLRPPITTAEVEEPSGSNTRSIRAEARSGTSTVTLEEGH